MSSKKSSGRNAVGLAAAVVTVVPVVAPLVEKVVDGLTVRLLPKSELVMIPPLYDKGFPIKLEEAVESLNVAGLKLSQANSPLKRRMLNIKIVLRFR